eukprot:TRINITY_DN1213_c0_g1_i3.p1 TRINITY_DN1213_c0_g1~~TRINITY_DN1213_c0_g1_i3.p1  ORF type:complete len:168 (-),score=16.22 TRINITY_DN1213_c0_g1_i3:137-640(-)
MMGERLALLQRELAEIHDALQASETIQEIAALHSGDFAPSSPTETKETKYYSEESPPSLSSSRDDELDNPETKKAKTTPEVSAPDESDVVLYEAFSSTQQSKFARKRKRLPSKSRKILEGWFNEHLKHPYPSEDEKTRLVALTDLSIVQIDNWFSNARRRRAKKSAD